MADIMETVNSILSDPSAMEQLKALGGMLGVGEAAEKSSEPAPPPKPEPPAADGIASLLASLSGGNSQGTSAPPSAAPMNMPSPEMMGMIMKFAPLLGSMNEENDSTRLLYALKPFLSEKRRKRVDQSVRILGIMRILPMVKEIGIF